MPPTTTIIAHYEPGLQGTARLVFTVDAAHREALRRIEGLARSGMRGGIYGYATRVETEPQPEPIGYLG